MGAFRSMDIGQRREALAALAVNIGRHLPEGWHVDTNLTESERENDDRVWFRFNDTKMRFTIAYDSSSSSLRINVHSWTWPQYTIKEYGRNSGQVKTETVWPHQNLYPKEEIPSISCSAAKSPDKIGRDIGLRFIKEYVRIYERAQHKATELQIYHDEAAALWQSVCAVLGVDSNRTHCYTSAHGYGAIGPLSVEFTGGKYVKISGSVNLDTIKALKKLYDEGRLKDEE